MAGRIYNTQQLHGNFEDPIERGILRKSYCRHYRAKLRAERLSNVIHGCLIMVTFTAIICSVIAYRFIYLADSKTETNLDQDHMKPTTPFWNIDVWKYLTDEKPQNVLRDSYCSQPINTTVILEKMREEVLNQDHALQKLEYTLRRSDNFKAVALVGPSGVGKSLTTEVLRKVYPWPENVHIYLWSTIVPDEAKKFSLLRHYIQQLSSCGQNLLIIDNLKSCDYNFVSIFNNLVQERGGDGSGIAAIQNVLIVYVFNLDAENYWGQFELLQQLPADTAVISFRSFGEEELADCLCHILKMEKRFADKQVFSDIMSNISVCKTGCKNVRREVISRTDVRLSSDLLDEK